MRTIYAVIGALFLASPCLAEDRLDTIQDLYSECKSPESIAQISCLRFISGVASAMQGVGFVASDTSAPREHRLQLIPFAMCNSEPVSLGQMKQVFINWAEKHPTQWQGPEGGGVWLALQEAWPCHL